jgi:hypothetical protein
VDDLPHDLGLGRFHRHHATAALVDDAVAVGRDAAGEGALLESLHQPVPGAGRELAAEVLRDDKLHAACEGVGPLRHGDELHAGVLELLADDVRVGGPAEPVELVDVHPPDLAGVGVGQERDELGATAHGAAGLRAVDVVPAGTAGGALAVLNLDVDRGAVVLGVAAVAGVKGVGFHGFTSSGDPRSMQPVMR